ncbi:protein of unknown function DUF721 [Acidothermus cellulolyticus 11B]|uniref:DUF721 domain-containing protein n=1 Tax=Acidothermus cellulolyticus (strain ATCC 43068 / DSM 8971 / 11B) TaxID=351607 RepID=A0LQS0_ACIC1|nr:DciA family protein [Acidothermus cellulolyticus]ABK51780.1 protein of unknown function DUF721 [Acidothermus cellulolyticus 11B]
MPTDHTKSADHADGPDLARAALRRARERARRAGQPPLWSTRRDPQTSTGEPELLGASVHRILRDLGWLDRITITRLVDEWPKIIGPELAQHCRPESYDRGVLHIQADSTAWATQLRLLLPQLTARVQEAAGDLIRLVDVRGPTAPSWRHGPLRVRGAGPRDTYG